MCYCSSSWTRTAAQNNGKWFLPFQLAPPCTSRSSYECSRTSTAACGWQSKCWALPPTTNAAIHNTRRTSQHSCFPCRIRRSTSPPEEQRQTTHDSTQLDRVAEKVKPTSTQGCQGGADGEVPQCMPLSFSATNVRFVEQCRNGCRCTDKSVFRSRRTQPKTVVRPRTRPRRRVPSRLAHMPAKSSAATHNTEVKDNVDVDVADIDWLTAHTHNVGVSPATMVAT